MRDQWLNILSILLVTGLVIGVLYYQTNLGRGKSGRIRERPTVNFQDVAGIEEAKSEVQEVVDFLRDPAKFQRLGGKLPKGVLLIGPPGTGKSMAAAVIAQELGLELYQIDLARVVSKYVGETEQHLARLFDAAEAGHAVLLFDEADALFARRTDVKSSNDRYANLEVNYLLQRMESFAGITILTTNAETVIDEAFRRRLAFRITFPLPEAEERARLWRTHLPAAAAVAGDIDVDALAQRYAMSGGYIKNAVLRAAFLAADEGSAITMGHLTRAAGLEYAAMGKVLSQGR
jgi:SpoVK/Ycf46/Vps4 family AAA+-type ATPase